MQQIIVTAILCNRFSEFPQMSRAKGLKTKCFAKILLSFVIVDVAG